MIVLNMKVKMMVLNIICISMIVMIVRIMTKILKIKIMKIIVMYINVLIMIVRMLKMIVKVIVKDDSKSDSIENSVYWCDSEASEYKGWVIKLVLTTPVKF